MKGNPSGRFSSTVVDQLVQAETQLQELLFVSRTEFPRCIAGLNRRYKWLAPKFEHELLRLTVQLGSAGSVCVSVTGTWSLTACSCFLFMSLMCQATLCMVSIASWITSYISESFSRWVAISCKTPEPLWAQTISACVSLSSGELRRSFYECVCVCVYLHAVVDGTLGSSGQV